VEVAYPSVSGSEEALRCFGTQLHRNLQSRSPLIRDNGANVIADSVQLTAGRSGQEYNQRKGRHGAFWEDRYHATVRAGVVTNPSDWAHSGYREIQDPPKRYGIVNLRELSSLCGFDQTADLQQAHRDWVKEALSREGVVREANWSEAVAIGSWSFVNKVKTELGFKAAHREVMERAGTYALREKSEA
jgi:putative transposase